MFSGNKGRSDIWANHISYIEIESFALYYFKKKENYKSVYSILSNWPFNNSLEQLCKRLTKAWQNINNINLSRGSWKVIDFNYPYLEKEYNICQPLCVIDSMSLCRYLIDAPLTDEDDQFWIAKPKECILGSVVNLTVFLSHLIRNLTPHLS